MAMNLTELFEIQRKLDAEIEKKHPTVPGEDRLAKRILALQVELGECANEWRGFKFWSTDQAPRIAKTIQCHACKGEGEISWNEFSAKQEFIRRVSEVCLYCEGSGIEEQKNSLLEEYVDCLHFILSIGLDLKFDNLLKIGSIELKEKIDFIPLEEKFIRLNYNLVKLYESVRSQNNECFSCWCFLVGNFGGLGATLGFTWVQIENAYMNKNQINWERQADGY